MLIHFKENAEETAKDKIKRLLKSEFENA
ncbi:MAG: transposon-encoded TnpW family protein [Clostridiales bacterium]|nr:transposon-encoded TnpW family protein [Clostridiales bacterium]